MKKGAILLLILFSLTFAGNNQLQYDECKTDVYYANGINTSEPEAKKSKDLLKIKMKKNIYDDSKEKMFKHIGDFYLAYNQTDGETWDLVESAIQKKLTDEELKEFYKEMELIYGDTPDKNNSDKWYYDLHTQIKGYIDSIKNHSHKVLIVAHSQGNLFTYQAYKLLEMNSGTQWMTNYMYVVSVASPLSSDITPNTPVVCFDNDLVCKLGFHSGIKNPVRNVKWSCDDEDDKTTKPLLSNYLYENEIGREYNGCTSNEAFWGLDWGFKIHAFSYYMGENVLDEDNQIAIDPFTFSPLHTDLATNQILSYIKQGLETLSKKPSMWKLDDVKVLCNNSCQYDDIMVKAHHIKEDLTIEVLPFNTTNYKIYPVEGKLVAAECGGEKIEQNWTNKTDNQCYLLYPLGDIISTIKERGFYVSYKDKSAFYNKDTFFTVASNGCSCFPYWEYTFNVKYCKDGSLKEESWTASRHTTHTWIDDYGDVLQIGNGAGHRWIHGGINFYVDMKE